MSEGGGGNVGVLDSSLGLVGMIVALATMHYCRIRSLHIFILQLENWFGALLLCILWRLLKISAALKAIARKHKFVTRSFHM